ncbi:RNG1L [Acrasis kona]|uniref:RNG1L n=1 Tax=Acrasis kona TaxID=1008807 RepID=A0AAW2ZQP9_9EUKA
MFDYLRRLFGLTSEEENREYERQQQESRENQSVFWSAAELIVRYGPAVQSFLTNLAEAIQEQERQVQEHEREIRRQSRQRNIHSMSGLPVITGNPYLDQFIMMSNGPQFVEHATGHFGPIHFNIQTGEQPGQQSSPFNLPTMEEILTAAFQQAQQTNSNPTDQSAIHSLPIVRMTPDRLEYKHKLNESADSEACSVCIEDYELEEQLIQLPCEHIFHKHCIVPWIKEHNTCPTCRYELPLSDPEAERERVKRMNERFTPQGLQIMNISGQDNSVFDLLDQVKIEYNKAKEQGDKSRANDYTTRLNQLDAQLEQSMFKLDGMNNVQQESVKHQRRSEILKIQFLQSRIDETKKSIEEWVGDSK